LDNESGERYVQRLQDMKQWNHPSSAALKEFSKRGSITAKRADRTSNLRETVVKIDEAGK
jgi:hypothetical protein